MAYRKQILTKNRKIVAVYLCIGIMGAFLSAYKISLFQKVIDGFSNGEALLFDILLYGSVFIFSSALDYLDEYPSNKLNHGIFLEYKLLALKKISTIDFLEYQKSGRILAQGKFEELMANCPYFISLYQADSQ